MMINKIFEYLYACDESQVTKFEICPRMCDRGTWWILLYLNVDVVIHGYSMTKPNAGITG